MRMLPVMVAVVVGACGGSAKKPEPAQPVENHPDSDAVLARQQAIEAAQNAGVLGSMALCAGGSTYGGDAYGGVTYGDAGYGCGGAFSSITGTGDLSSGFDDTEIYGGLLGNEAGELTGQGDGTSGVGSGGGGTGDGTIGTGSYGTLGHGSGTGSGYGVGGGGGGMHGQAKGVPNVSIGQPNAVGDLDKAIIRRYVKRNIQKIAYCYEKQLIDHPDLAGTVQMQFTIGVDGVVTSSHGSGVDPDVAACVAGVIKAIEFPKPKGGGTVQVNYPFTFRGK